MNITVLYLLLVPFLWGCSNNSKDPILIDFNKTVDIKSQKSSISSVDLGEIVDMLYLDSNLIINEAFQDLVFKYFDVASGKKVSSFIRRGKGPNELSFPRLLNIYNDSIFTTYEENKKELIYFNFHDIRNKKYQFYKTISFDSLKLSIFKNYPLNDSSFLFLGAFNEGKYCLYNNKTKRSLINVDFPKDGNHKGEDNYILGWAHQGEIAIKPDRKEFVFVCKNGYFDICSIGPAGLTLKTRKVYYLSEYKLINNSVAYASKSNYAFRSVSSTNKYIYVIYSGRSEKEHGSEYFAGNNLLVYDWDGNPIVNFKTDRYLKRMSLNIDKLIVYGFCTNPYTGEPEIVTYNLPDH